MTDTNTIIDTAISAGNQAAENPADNAAAEVTQQVDGNEEAKAPESDETDTPWPKKAVNAMSRKDKQLGKYRYENQLLKQRLDALEAAQKGAPQAQAAQVKQAPKDTDYDTYGEYLNAAMQYQIDNKLQETSKKQDEQRQAKQKTQQYQQWEATRSQTIASGIQKTISENPGVEQLIVQAMTENNDLLDNMPKHIEQAFLESDNAHLALLALSQEGQLEAVMAMSPYQAAMAIAKAEARGEALLKARKQVTKAPQPMAAAKGTGHASKGLSQMSVKDLLKEMNS